LLVNDLIGQMLKGGCWLTLD